MTDIVYLVREGDSNDELRHSLRSLRHLPHGTVWFAGYLPSWARNVEHIHTHQHASKYRNSTANLRAACNHPGVSDEFVLFNDDFFVMHPIDEVPALHRGPVSEVVRDYRRRHPGSPYLRGMQQTAGLLARMGVRDPVSYELHVPMVIEKRQMNATIEAGCHLPVLHKRTLYGNQWRVGGTQVPDCKVRNDQDRFTPSDTFLSTSDLSFANSAVGRHIRSCFPAPSPYEEG